MSSRRPWEDLSATECFVWPTMRWNERNEPTMRTKEKSQRESINLSLHVFTRDELVIFYVQGLRNAVREMVAHQVRKLPHS